MTVEVTYVVGLGRSGSTVVGRALAQSIGALAGDELMAVWQRGVLEDRVCSCGVVFSGCPFWRDVVTTSPLSFDTETARRVVDEIHRVMRVFGPLRVTTPRRRAALVESMPGFWFDAMGALYRGVATVGGSASIVDTSKAPVLGWLLAHCPGVSVRTVLLVRDPRAVARSWTRPPALPEGAHELPVLAAWQTAVVWLVCNAAGERVHAALGGTPATVMRLEDFVDAPEVVLARVTSGLGERVGAAVDARDDALEATPGGARVAMGPVATAGHTMSGHPSVRFSDREVVVRRVVDPAGSSVLSDALVTAIDAPLMRRFGYALGGAR